MFLTKNTSLFVRDNSGARRLKIIAVHDNKASSGADKIGDSFLVLVKKAVPHKKVKRGERFGAVLFNSKTNFRRMSGFIRCSDNIGVCLKKSELLPVANRIYVRALLEMRSRGFFRMILISRGLI